MNDKNNQAYHIVQHQMLDKDAFSQWLGIQLLHIEAGNCQLQMQVKVSMCNGFGIAHGGICYSLADSALAFASNAHGRHAKSIDTSIRHFKSVQVGDRLIATATEEQCGHKTAHYSVRIVNQDGEQVALFNGTVYRGSTNW